MLPIASKHHMSLISKKQFDPYSKNSKRNKTLNIKNRPEYFKDCCQSLTSATRLARTTILIPKLPRKRNENEMTKNSANNDFQAILRT